jgi:hypothetical protein
MIHRSSVAKRVLSITNVLPVILAGATSTASASDNQLKISNNFLKVERTIAYLAKVESYRFPETVSIKQVDDSNYKVGGKRSYAGIAYVKEADLFLIIIPIQTLSKFTARELQLTSAHELCHGIIHNARLRKGEMILSNSAELEADRCAVELLTRYSAEVKAIWR